MTRLLLLIYFFFLSHLYAQTIKRVQLKNGEVKDFPVQTIDSISFGSADKLLIHLDNSTVVSLQWNDIDSVTFFTSTPFNAGLIYETVSDIEGNTYKTIRIGNQTWMAENLRVTKFRNNAAIQNISDSLQWATIFDNNTQASAWSYYLNDASLNTLYGKLYNWHAAVNPNGICPQGWHVPSDGEWTTLTNSLGGEEVAAGKMKSAGTVYWKSPNADAVNSSGFSAIAGGLRYYYSSFDFLFDFGTWWSTTADNDTRSWARYLSYNFGAVFRTSSIKENGFSIRCVKD